VGGTGGDALAGALLNSSGSTATVTGSRFIANAALGGSGGEGSGGNAQGGAIADVQIYDWFGLPTVLTVVDCSVSGNVAAGGAGASGGSSQGSGLYLGAQSTTTIRATKVTANTASGGDYGGLGQGGGVFVDPLAVACADALTKLSLRGNHATSSGDDLFGFLGDCP
jgi:hypothetical protein